MPFRPSKWVIYAPVAVLPVLAAIVLESRDLQEGIARRATDNLVAAGAGWAKIAVDGRDAALSGDAPSAAQADAAVNAVMATRGVRLVNSAVRVVEPPPPSPTVEPQSGIWGTFDIAGTWPEGGGNTLSVALAGASYALGADTALESNGEGRWTLKPPRELDPGSYDVIATVTAPTGLISTDTSKDEIVVAEPPVLAPPTVDALATADSTPEITGTWDPEVATSLAVTLDDTTFRLGTDAALTASGKAWTLVPPQPLADGSHGVVAEVGDRLGRTERTPSPVGIVIDTAAPAQPTVGALESARPLRLSGRWPSGDAVSLTLSLAGRRWALGQDPAVTSDAGGAWRFAPDIALAPGTYDLAVEVADAVGNVSRDQTADEIVIPPLPELRPPTVAPLVTNAVRPEIRGTWPSAVAKSLNVGVGGKTYSLGTSRELGSTGDDWRLNLPEPLADGDYDVTVDVADDNGRSASSEAPGKLVVDTVPPAAPVVAPVTRTAPLEIAGTWPEGDAVSLAAKLGQRTYELGRDPALTSDGQGNWSLKPEEALPPGAHDLDVVVTDRAGNVSSDASQGEIVIAAPPPPEPEPEPEPAPPETAPPAPPAMLAPTIAESVSLMARPVIEGTWSELAATALKVDVAGQGFELGRSPELSTDGIGNWSLAVPAPLADGTYDILAASTDASGRTLADASRDELLVDARGPATPTVDLFAGDASPSRLTGRWDWENADSLSVRVPSAALDATLGGDPALTSAAGVWTLALAAPLPPGSHDVAVETVDGRGRVATDQTRFEILVRAPDPEPAPPEPAPPEPAPPEPAPPEPAPVAMTAPTVDVYGGEVSPAAIAGTWDEAVAKTLTVSVVDTPIAATLGSDPELTSNGQGRWTLALDSQLSPGIYDVQVETVDAQGSRVTDTTTAEIVIAAAPDPAPPEPVPPEPAPPEPAPPEPEPVSPEPAPPPFDCEGAFAAIAGRTEIRFDFDRWDLSEPVRVMLRDVAALMKDERCADRRLEVAGHADVMGGRLYNEALSIRRAQVVVDALAGEGVGLGRISLDWFGARAPRDLAVTREARAHNRRVTLTMVK